MKLDENRMPITIGSARQSFLLYYLAVFLFIIVLPIIGVVKDLFQLFWFAIFGLILLGAVEMFRVYKVIEIEHDKICTKLGLINLQHKSVYFSEITHIEIKQNFLERIFRYGKLYIYTAGTDRYEISMEKLSHPHKVRDFLEDLKHKHARQQTPAMRQPARQAMPRQAVPRQAAHQQRMPQSRMPQQTINPHVQHTKQAQRTAQQRQPFGRRPGITRDLK